MFYYKNFVIIFLIFLLNDIKKFAFSASTTNLLIDKRFCNESLSFCEKDQIHIKCLKINENIEPNPMALLFKNLELSDAIQKNLTDTLNYIRNKNSSTTPTNLIWNDNLQALALKLLSLDYDDNYEKICYNMDKNNIIKEISFEEKSSLSNLEQAYNDILPDFIKTYEKIDSVLMDLKYKYIGCSIGFIGNKTYTENELKCLLSENNENLEFDKFENKDTSIEHQKVCESHEILCNNKKECYIETNKCDGYPDCSDGSDEKGCSGNVDTSSSTEPTTKETIPVTTSTTTIKISITDSTTTTTTTNKTPEPSSTDSKHIVQETKYDNSNNKKNKSNGSDRLLSITNLFYISLFCIILLR